MTLKLGKIICLVGIMILLSAGHVMAWEWQSFPEGQQVAADLSGEVYQVSPEELTLQLEDGTRRRIRIAPECHITLNGYSVEPRALGPIGPRNYVEARIKLDEDQAVMISGFYCRVEARVVAVTGTSVCLRPVNTSADGKWYELTAFPGEVLPKVGDVYLLNINSWGQIKEVRQLSGPGGEQSVVANNFKQSRT